MVRHNASNGKEKSAQDSIPYERLYPDGICKVEGDFYSKTILFEDINYQLAENEDKTAIFDGWCDFLNYFDPQINFQLSFLNLMGNEKTFEDSITIKEQDDAFNGIRREYSEMLLSQLSKGNNGILKRKYLTFGTNAKNYKKAKPRLERIESEVKSNLKRLGVRMESLDGKARLNLFHNMIHMDDNQSFHFDWKWLVPTGLSTKDFIAPSSFYFGDAKMYKTGNRVGTVSFLHILAPEISDRILADFLEIDGNQSITIHVKSIDHIKAVKMVKAKLTDLERIKIDEQKKAVRSGYDMDILSSDLALYITDVKKLLQDLQSRNERLFYFTLMISHTDVTKDKLDNTVFAATSLAQKMGCVLYRLDYQQEEGFMSMLPLAKNRIDINRSINTTGTAGFMPFTTSELFQKGDGALYYGINAISNNLLMADRKLLKNPKGLYHKRTEEQYITKATIIFLFTLSELERKRVPQKSQKQC